MNRLSFFNFDVGMNGTIALEVAEDNHAKGAS